MSAIAEAASNIFKIEELRKRVFWTAFILLIWRLGSHLPLPYINYDVLVDITTQGGKADPFTSFFSLFSGGALGNAAVFSLGIMPYISSSIIMQLLVKVFPNLEQLQKEGPSGQRKISQYTRLLTVPIALIQAVFITFQYIPNMLDQDGTLIVGGVGFGYVMTSILALTLGALIVMWLGEQITEFGLGNGASLIIMAGIVVQMPPAISYIVNALADASSVAPIRFDQVIILALLYVGVVFGIVYITQAQRRIPIQHAKHVRGRRVAGGHRHYLPLRVNQAGVMPVIFASSLLIVPMWLGSLLGESFSQLFARGAFTYCLVYIGMTFFFSYFWTYLYFNPPEMSSQLKEYGSFVPGIRPGKKTSDFLEFIMNRITLAGATFLCIIALIPDIVSALLGVSGFLTTFLGGTGILIVVGVGLDLIQKIESHLVMHNYPGFSGSGRSRGRR